jgi:cobalt-precorrin 5A hydrolase
MRVAGLGFRAAATEAALLDALAKAGGAEGLTALATAADKVHHPAPRALAARLGLPLHAVPLAAIAAAPATAAAPAPARYGGKSLAEAAALAAAGPQARLVARRARSADGLATAALAEAPP